MTVLAPLAVIALWWAATHGKGTAPGRLVAWLVAVIVVWVFIAVNNPAVGGNLASGFASGIGQFMAALGRFLGMV